MRLLPMLVLTLLAGCSEAAVGAIDAATTEAGPQDADAIDLGIDPIDATTWTCTLTASGPIVVDTPGAIVENLDVTSDGSSAAITIRADAVTVRDVRVRHQGGTGIAIEGAAGVRIERVDVENTGAPTSGPNTDADQNNIAALDAPSLVIQHVRLTRGSSGIYLQASPGSMLTEIEGHDFRGPFPRGQLVQWNASDDGLLDGFSVVNDAGSWPEDDVNAYHSVRVAIRNGLVDGNNSPSGVGVIFDEGASGSVASVDAVHMGNGCFSTYAGLGGSDFTYTRCRDNVCTDQGRGLPSSNALMWAANPDGTLTRLTRSSYWASCNGNVSWPNSSFAPLELTEQEFTPRAALTLDFCFGR